MVVCFVISGPGVSHNIMVARACGTAGLLTLLQPVSRERK
jgi:hypothetical protein